MLQIGDGKVCESMADLFTIAVDSSYLTGIYPK